MRIRPRVRTFASFADATAAVIVVLLLLSLGGCGNGEGRPPASPQISPDPGTQPTPSSSNLSPNASTSTHEMLQEDIRTPRGPADGGGRAWLVRDGAVMGPPTYSASSRQSFEIVYQAGPLGIAVGGAVLFQPSPFWDWDTPQGSYPDSPGYTGATTDAIGVGLSLYEGRGQPLAIAIEGRPLALGEQIRILYGAGPARARVDEFAEEGERLWVLVDGDGDGVRALIADSPAVDIVAKPPAMLRVTLPTTGRPGESVRLLVATLDARGNLSPGVPGEIEFFDRPPGLELPQRVVLAPGHPGHVWIEARVLAAGLHVVSARGHGELQGLTGSSNPLVARASGQTVLWGDLHGHSQLSDGTGSPDQYFEYARDAAGLDVSALTDHDHWGMQFLDDSAKNWSQIRESVKRHHEPGRFVTLLGYEWTSWLHGHRHVLYFSDEGEVLSSADPRYETPADLWTALAGQSALTFAHHSAGGPVATNWRFPPDPILEPVTEIVSVHGSSEAMDSPGRIYEPIPGNFVRDVLGLGRRLGFIGSGDSHDGHPGLAHLSQRSGGLAAFLTEDRTREGVLAALRERRVYATNGPRIYLNVTLGSATMGSVLPASSEGGGGKRGAETGDTLELSVEVVGTAPIERLDLIRSGQVASVAGTGGAQLVHVRDIPRLRPGEFHYVRVLQEDGGTAWSSPIFAE